MISIPPTLNLLCGMVVLFPVAIYCLFIARINRRPWPVVVSGARDCAGIILALSGFLFFLWPSLITGFNYWPRDIWLYNHYSSLKGLGHQWWWAWWILLWLVYVFVVFGGCFLLLWSRRNVTVVYNVDPAVLNTVLESLLDRLGVSWTRNQQHILIGYGTAVAKKTALEPDPAGNVPDSAGVEPPRLDDLSPETTPAEPMDALTGYRVVLQVNPWPAFRHVTLHWSSIGGSPRLAIEAALRRELAQVRTLDNPAGHWLMAVCACQFTLLFILTVLFQIARMRGDW